MWIFGYMEIWIHMNVEIWIHGYMDIYLLALLATGYTEQELLAIIYWLLAI